MRFMQSALSTLGLVVLISSVPVAAQQSTDNQPSQQTAKPATAKRAAPITYTLDGKVSVTVAKMSLRTVLLEISRRAQIPILLSDTYVDRLVTVDMRDVPVDEGLRQLLTAFDAFYLYSSDEQKSPGSIKTVWVFERGEGRDLQPVPPEQWASTKELERQLEDPDPEVRGETYEALVERQGEKGLATVRKGLSDPDDSVRLRTLSSAIDVDVDIPARELEPLILDVQGSSQAMRVLALQAIADKPEAEAIATTLANDPDDMVRQQALLILERRRRPPV
jgi:hypothetical protein